MVLTSEGKMEQMTDGQFETVTVTGCVYANAGLAPDHHDEEGAEVSQGKA